ncbi:MAG: ABC transporter permease [Candidatus Zixiibacteriota bacterium]
MIKNFFKIAIRSIIKQRWYAVINIIGLAIGISCIAMAFLYAQYEFSFDRFHKDANRIYRVVSKETGVSTPSEMSPTMMERYPEVESATRLQFGSYDKNRVLFYYHDKSFYSEGYFADERFFDVFSFPFIMGEPRKALTEPNTLVITKGFARKYFGDDDPIGETISFDKKYDLRVTGVIDDIPSNSHLQFDFLVSFATYAATASGKSYTRCWACNLFLTYVKLHDNVEIAPLNGKLDEMILEKTGTHSDYFIQPMTDIRLFSGLDREPGTSNISDIYYVHLALSISLLILILGCLNYINIATARISSRANEIGIRKMIGAGKRLIIIQYIIESLLMTFFAMILSVILMELLIPWVNSYANIDIEISFINNPPFLLFAIFLCFAVGIVAGGYPALVLSAIKPLRVINNIFIAGRDGVRLRQLFVIIQFGAAVCLLIITLIINLQLYYVDNLDVGYDKNNIVVMKLKGEDFEKNKQSIKNEILKHSKVLGATYSDALPHLILNSTTNKVADEKGDSADLSIYFCEVDENFTDVFNISIVGGRNFSPEFNDTRESSVILNESAIRAIDKENPIGRPYTMGGNIDAKVIGVVKDFNFLPLHKSIAPLVLLYGDGKYLSVKIQSGSRESTIKSIEEIVRRLVPDYPFEYKMLDDYYRSAYSSENNLNIALNVFAAIAIIVACLGLMGLSSFSAAQKSKEIAIRKVLGASVSDIVKMLSKEYIVLVAIANIIAWPIAFYVVKTWLENFVYRVNIELSMFFAAGFSAILIALITVSFQAIKAALADPIDGIRHE